MVRKNPSREAALRAAFLTHYTLGDVNFRNALNVIEVDDVELPPGLSHNRLAAMAVQIAAGGLDDGPVSLPAPA